MPNPKSNKKNTLLEFKQPTLEFTENAAKPFRKYFTPEFFGIEKLDKDKPALYVTNHTIFGITDGALFGAEVYKEKGIFFRSLVDHIHTKVPYWKDYNKNFGCVEGSRENCRLLMEQGEHIMVFPGGGRETMKLKGEKYKLTWKKRTGFARMAIEMGYDIIPVVQLGGDDAYDIIADSKDILNSAIGKYLKKTTFYKTFLRNGEILPPLAKGFLFTPLPKPVKLYWKVGDRIDTKRFDGKSTDKNNQWQIRNEVELAMDKMFIELFEYRKTDPENNFWRKLLNKI